MCGPPQRLKPAKPVLPATDLLDHRLSRSGHQHYLVAWADESIEPTWEPVEDISTDIVGMYQDVLAERCPLMPPGVFF